MRLVIHHGKFYDWDKLPREIEGKPVEVTAADVASGKVKSDGEGWWKARVVKEAKGGTHTQVNLSEEQIFAKVIHEKTRPEAAHVHASPSRRGVSP